LGKTAKKKKKKQKKKMEKILKKKKKKKKPLRNSYRKPLKKKSPLESKPSAPSLSCYASSSTKISYIALESSGQPFSGMLATISTGHL